MTLEAWMRLAGVSATTLAPRLGISLTAVYRYLRNERIPTRQVMLRIAHATDGAVGPIDFYPDCAGIKTRRRRQRNGPENNRQAD